MLRVVNYSMPKAKPKTTVKKKAPAVKIPTVKEKKIKYSTELARLLEHLKINHPTPLQDRMFKELNQEERAIYMAARKKKSKADRKKLFKLINKGIHKNG